MRVETGDPAIEQILDVFRRAVSRRLRGAVRLDARLQADLDMDSLKVISTVLAIEQELRIRVCWEATGAGEIRTVGDVIAFVTQRRADGSRND